MVLCFFLLYFKSRVCVFNKIHSENLDLSQLPYCQWASFTTKYLYILMELVWVMLKYLGCVCQFLL